jgi:hypothetical protein
MSISTCDEYNSCDDNTWPINLRKKVMIMSIYISVMSALTWFSKETNVLDKLEWVLLAGIQLTALDDYWCS